ncbi:GDSL-type esterase/lipase family protein [Actinophytocola sp. NPDC049390]|uniref:GDSL-type esterase/lipase family protein n=1 Tax=Actinophytocola sp. NPDC049390 TaxID=3363894 RepID=UPI00378DD3DB
MRPSGWLVLFLVLVVVTFGLTGDHRFPAPRPLPGPPEDAPRVIVAMGDSTISGEGAGDYETGTNGEKGNWCHRSANASIFQVRVPGVEKAYNLACSGAPSAQVGLGDVEQYTEISQAKQLARIAARNRVTAVVVASGANDDPAFSHVLDSCVQAWAGRELPCSQSVGPRWERRVDKMIPKLTNALRDIRTVMHNAGYQRGDYSLVVQSYAAPVGTDVARGLQDLSGCPFLSEDLRWVEEEAVPVLTAGVRTAARNVDARFLDLSRAGIGREACTSERDPDSEWFRRLAVEWNDLQHDDRATHALQESFHPNANGHEQFGQCLSEFLTSVDRAAACLPGREGNLHAAASPE